MLSRLKYWWLLHLITTTLKTSEMSSDIIGKNAVNGTGTLHEGPLPSRWPVGEQRRPIGHQKTAGTGWSKGINVAVMECYFLCRLFDEEGKPIRGLRKRIHNIWNERQGLKVTEQRLCDQARMIRMNGWLTELEMNAIKKCIMNENANKNDQNSGMTIMMIKVRLQKTNARI